MKKLLALLCLFAGTVVWSSSAFGQVFIEQGKVEATIRPGGTVTGFVSVQNTSDKKLAVRIYWEDFVYLEPFDGSKKFFPAGSVERSASEWIRFSNKEIVLPPFGKKKIKYSIRAPEDAQGGYYGVLFFENAGQEHNIQIGVRIVSRVGSLFFMETANQKKMTKVSDVLINDGKITGTLSNLGDVVVLAKGIYYVMDSKGFVVDRGELNKIYLPSSEQANFTIPLLGDLQADKYTVVTTFDLGKGDSSVKEIDLVKHPNSTIEIYRQRD